MRLLVFVPYVVYVMSCKYALLNFSGAAVCEQEVCFRRQEGHSRRHPIRLSNLRSLKRFATARIRENFEVKATTADNCLAKNSSEEFKV